jgi:hypothetical protein
MVDRIIHRGSSQQVGLPTLPWHKTKHHQMTGLVQKCAKDIFGRLNVMIHPANPILSSKPWLSTSRFHTKKSWDGIVLDGPSGRSISLIRSARILASRWQDLFAMRESGKTWHEIVKELGYEIDPDGSPSPLPIVIEKLCAGVTESKIYELAKEYGLPIDDVIALVCGEIEFGEIEGWHSITGIYHDPEKLKQIMEDVKWYTGPEDPSTLPGDGKLPDDVRGKTNFRNGCKISPGQINSKEKIHQSVHN